MWQKNLFAEYGTGTGTSEIVIFTKAVEGKYDPLFVTL